MGFNLAFKGLIFEASTNAVTIEVFSVLLQPSLQYEESTVK